MARGKRILALLVLGGVLAACWIVIAKVLDVLHGNVPIVFYGRVVDQDGQGVPGAIVTCLIQAERRLSIPSMGSDTSKTWDVSAKTDIQGNFSISDGYARDLRLTSVTAPGYIELRGASGEFFYASGAGEPPYKPDPKHPEMFQMWKLRGTEHLKEDHFRVHMKSDGRPYIIDLLKGWSHQGPDGTGDLRVSIVAPEEMRRGQSYSWKFKIEAIDGGLVAAPRLFPYEAPSEGYVPSLEFDMTTGHVNEALVDRYYLKSRSGNVYSTILMYPEILNGVTLDITYRVNTTGSRLLEP